MPRSQAVLHFDVFEGLDGCTDDEMLLYFAVLTEPTINQCGIGALRLSLWARRLRKPVDVVETALKGLDAKRFVFFDDRTEEILVRTLIRRDKVAEKPNLLWAAVRQAPLTRSLRLRRELAAELRKLPAQLPDTLTKAGRRFVHADPHAVADGLDPTPTPPADHPGEPFENRSRTHHEPISGEPFSNHTRTTGGGGGGGGGGSSSVGGHFGGSRASARKSPTPDEPTRCAKHAPLPADADVPPCGACAERRRTAERRLADGVLAEMSARTERRTAIDNCRICDEHGMREVGDAMARCTHPTLEAVS